MKPLRFKMDGKFVHSNAHFKLRLPVGHELKKERILDSIFGHILSNPRCLCHVTIDVSNLTKAEVHQLRDAIKRHDPLNTWDVELFSPLDLYRKMSARQRQVFLLIPLLTDVQIGKRLNITYHTVRELHKAINEITDCHCKDEISMLVQELYAAGFFNG